jgi:hypothetical protein
MTLEVSTQPLWIIEGVYGWLAEVALPRAMEPLPHSRVVHAEEQRIRTLWRF